MLTKAAFVRSKIQQKSKIVRDYYDFALKVF